MPAWFQRIARKLSSTFDDSVDDASQDAAWANDDLFQSGTGTFSNTVGAVTNGAATGQNRNFVTSPETISMPGSGLIFVNSYTSNVSTAYRNDILLAENYLQSHFINSVTVDTTFDLSSLGPGASGANLFNTVDASYAQLVSALTSHATSSADLAVVTSLQNLADPSSGAGFTIPTVEALILGLTNSNIAPDDSITLNTDFWTSSALQTSATDAQAVLEHEISEGVFGRVGGLGKTNFGSKWAPLDLFRFTASGQRDFTGGQDSQPTYFSIDGSSVATGLQYHSAISSSGTWDFFDLADWDQVGSDSNAQDPFGPGGPGVGDPGTLSATDLQILDVLGWINPSNVWNVSASSTTTIPQGGITVAVQGTNVSLTASGDIVNMVGGVTALLQGTGDTVNMGTGAGDVLNLGASSQAAVNGTSNSIGIVGDNVTLIASGETVNMVGDVSAVLQGTGNIVNMGDNARDTLNLVSNSSATVHGTGNSIGIIGSNATVTASSSIVNMVGGVSAVLQGTGNTVNMGDNARDTLNLVSNSSATVHGTGNSIGIIGSNATVTASSSIVNMVGNISAVLQGTGNIANMGSNAGDILNLVTNTQATVNGTGNSIGILGSNATVTASGEIVNMVGNVSAVLQGTGDIVNMGNNAGDIINLVTSAQATVHGMGNSVGIIGTNVSLTASGDIVNMVGGVTALLQGTGDTVNMGTGAGDVLNLGASSQAAVNGTSNSIGIVGDNVTLIASGETVNMVGDVSAVLQGTGNIVNMGDNARDTLNLVSNSSATVHGTGNSIGIIGSNATVTASSSIVNMVGGVVATVSGTGDTVNMGNNAGDTINIQAGSLVGFNGKGNSIGIVGSNVVLTASDEIVNMVSTVTALLFGTGDTVNMGINAGDRLNLASGTQTTVNAIGGTLGFYGTSSVTVVGGNDTFVIGSPTGNGQNTITNFQGSDVIDFSSSLFVNYAAVLQDTAQVGANTVIQHDANTSVTLINFTASNLTSSNFNFI
jgi:rRNA processing protein Krr1/Pno1